MRVAVCTLSIAWKWGVRDSPILPAFCFISNRTNRELLHQTLCWIQFIYCRFGEILNIVLWDNGGLLFQLVFYFNIYFQDNSFTWFPSLPSRVCGQAYIEIKAQWFCCHTTVSVVACKRGLLPKLNLHQFQRKGVVSYIKPLLRKHWHTSAHR